MESVCPSVVTVLRSLLPDPSASPSGKWWCVCGGAFDPRVILTASDCSLLLLRAHTVPAGTVGVAVPSLARWSVTNHFKPSRRAAPFPVPQRGHSTTQRPP